MRSSEDYTTADPAIQYAAKEAHSCAGCVHIARERAFGSIHQVCRLMPAHTLERKCRNYLPDERAI